MTYRFNGNIGIYTTRNADLTSLSNTGQTTYQKQYISGSYTISPVGVNYSVLCNTGNHFVISPTQNCTVNFVNVPSGVFYAFSVLVNFVTNPTAYTVTFPATVKWAFGQPVYADNTYTLVNLMYDNNGIYYGSYIPAYGA